MNIFRAFGLTLLIMLASCLLHLVATSYFLFTELLGDTVFVFDRIHFCSALHYWNFYPTFPGYFCCIFATFMVLFSFVPFAFNRWTMPLCFDWGKYLAFFIFPRIYRFLLSIWLNCARKKAGKTIIIICEVLRNCRDSKVEHIVSKRFQFHALEIWYGFISTLYIIRTKLQRFWRQLLSDRTYYFSAFGMTTIDRQILTSVRWFV